MGGKSACNEPTLLQTTEKAYDILEQVELAQYLSWLWGFDVNITLEFLQNLSDEGTKVRGRPILVTKLILEEVTSLPT